MYKKKTDYSGIYFIIFAAFFFLFVASLAYLSMQRGIEKENIISECIIEHKELPEPKDVCKAIYRAQLMKEKE